VQSVTSLLTTGGGVKRNCDGENVGWMWLTTLHTLRLSWTHTARTGHVTTHGHLLCAPPSYADISIENVSVIYSNRIKISFNILNISDSTVDHLTQQANT
jgi:hypothetical protein